MAFLLVLYTQRFVSFEHVLECDRSVVSIFAGLRPQRLVRDFYRALYQEAANNKQQLICM